MSRSKEGYENLTKSRKPEYMMDDAWIRSFLKDALVGHIATRWEMQPFITPSTFWYDGEQHVIYFHSNVSGRIRRNAEKYPEVCFEAAKVGEVLPSNIALAFSIQYASVVAFGRIRVIEDESEKRKGLYGLIRKYFPDMHPGEHFRPITEEELAQTSVYAIDIISWSGKKNWKERAGQSDEWRPLPGAGGE